MASVDIDLIRTNTDVHGDTVRWKRVRLPTNLPFQPATVVYSPSFELRLFRRKVRFTR